MAEVLHANLAKIEASDVLKRLGLEPHQYMLLSAHREENIDTEKNFLDLFTSINHLAESLRHAHFVFLPSAQPQAAGGDELPAGPPRQTARAAGLHDYNHLQMNAFCVVSEFGARCRRSRVSF